MLWLSAGEAEFSVSQLKYNNKICYHFIGNGYTYPKYDIFYKVRDRFETICDSLTFKPIRYIRDTREGGNRVYNDNVFNFKKNLAYSFTPQKNHSIKTDSTTISKCSFDVLTMIYFARNIDFNNYPVNSKIPISLYLDNHVYSLYIQYLGKEKMKTDLGEFNCVKFHPLLVEGTIFKAGDEMTVWVSDDMNKLPIYVETPIIIGSIKVKLKSFEALKNTLTSKIK